MGDEIIPAIRANHQFFAPAHTAECPGRGQPDETQELDSPAVSRALAKTGYDGHIAHEFIPKGDPLEALKRAFDACAAA